MLCVGRDDAELARRAAAIGRDVDELRANALAGTPGEVVARIGEFAELGVTRLYLQVLDLADLDHLELAAPSCCRRSEPPRRRSAGVRSRQDATRQGPAAGNRR